MVLTRAQLVFLSKEELKFSKYSQQYPIYIRKEMLEVNPVPQSISNDDMKQSICRALSLTNTTIKLDDIHACHRMKSME